MSKKVKTYILGIIGFLLIISSYCLAGEFPLINCDPAKPACPWQPPTDPLPKEILIKIKPIHCPPGCLEQEKRQSTMKEDIQKINNALYRLAKWIHNSDCKCPFCIGYNFKR